MATQNVVVFFSDGGVTTRSFANKTKQQVLDLIGQKIATPELVQADTEGNDFYNTVTITRVRFLQETP